MLVTDGVATLCIGETEYRSKFGHCQSVTTLDLDEAFAPGCNGSTDLAHQPTFHAD